jgi:folate-binding protein YgfZ
MGGNIVASTMTAPFARQVLPNRALIRLAGENVLSFLNNIITADVGELPPGQIAYGALLSPQGKIQHEMFVINEGDSILIDGVRSQRDELIRKLIMYRLRAKISIEPEDQLAVVADPSMGSLDADPRLDVLGNRSEVSGVSGEARTDYDVYRLSLGIPDGESDIGVNAHFPHEANLDLLNGLSFSKGCYVGQEVVSRVQHRGTARSRMLPVTCDGPAPAGGTAITSGETQIGTILSSQGLRAMALVRLDRLAEVKAPLLSAGVRVHVHKPEWMNIDVTIPEAAR